MCTDVSFSAPHLLHEEGFALLILCGMCCRLICPGRSPTDILPCFLSSSLTNWTYLSVGPSRHNCLIPYFSQTSHSVCFLFSIQFLILDLNLLKDNGRKGSGPIVHYSSFFQHFLQINISLISVKVQVYFRLSSNFLPLTLKFFPNFPRNATKPSTESYLVLR